MQLIPISKPLTVVLFIYVGCLLNVLCINKCSKVNSKWNDIFKSHRGTYKVYVDLQVPISRRCKLPSGNVCCSKMMSYEMHHWSTLNMKSNPLYEPIFKRFMNDTKFLRNYFNESLDVSFKALDKLFKKTYTNKYTNNREFFYKLISDFKRYLFGEYNDITKVLDTFFMDTIRRIISMMSTTRLSFDTLQCHIKKLLDLKPYEAIDVEIKNDILKAYAPARMLLNAAEVGRDVMYSLMNDVDSINEDECIRDYNRKENCRLCANQLEKICQHTCRAFVNKCVFPYSGKETNAFSKTFQRFMNKVSKICAKLSGIKNFYKFTDKFRLRLSSAVMNVQRRYGSFQGKISFQCRNRRTKRQIRSNDSAKTLNSKYDQSYGIVKPPTYRGDVLSKWSDENYQKIVELKTYFKDIEEKFCRETRIPIKQCWNGTSTIPASKLPFIGQKTYGNTNTINDATQKLRIITKKLGELDSLKTKNPDVVQTNKNFEIKIREKLKKQELKMDGSGTFDIDNPLNEINTSPSTVARLTTTMFSRSFDGSGILDQNPSISSPSINKNIPNRQETNNPYLPDDEDLNTQFGTKKINTNGQPINPTKKYPKLDSLPKNPSIGSGDIPNSYPVSTQSVTTTKEVKNKYIDGSGMIKTSPTSTLNGFITKKPKIKSPKPPTNFDGSGDFKKFGEKMVGVNEDDDDANSGNYPGPQNNNNEVKNKKQQILKNYPGEIPSEIWIPGSTSAENNNIVSTPKKASNTISFSFINISSMIVLVSIFSYNM